jgi:DNA-binding transcriptional ArsR family regulator
MSDSKEEHEHTGPKFRLRRLKISKIDRVAAGSNPGSIAMIYKSNNRDGVAVTTEKEAPVADSEETDLAPEGLDSEAVAAQIATMEAELATAKSELEEIAGLSLDGLAERFGLAPAEAEVTEPEVDAVLKALPDEVRERIEKAEARVAAMELSDRQRHFEAIAKAELAALPAEAGELGEVLRSVADSVGDNSEAYALVERVLKGAASQATKAQQALTQASAADGVIVNDAEAAITKAAAEIAATEGVDIGAAMASVRKSSPDLWSAYQAERSARIGR